MSIQLHFMKPMVVVLFAVYSEANVKDNDDYIYRNLCIGLRYEEMDAVTLIKEVEKIRGKLNLLDVNVDALKNIFEKLMTHVRARAEGTYQRQIAEQKFRSISDGRKLKYCVGYYGEVPIPRVLYDKLQEYVSSHPGNSFLYTGPGQHARLKDSELSKTSATPQEQHTIRFLLNYIARRAAYKHWVEIGNGVHKTELEEPPPDHLKNRLLYLLHLKEKTKNW